MQDVEGLMQIHLVSNKKPDIVDLHYPVFHFFNTKISVEPAMQGFFKKNYQKNLAEKFYRNNHCVAQKK